MKRAAFLFALLATLPTIPCRAADWQPAKGPLMTRWAKDVSPDRVHSEYPRPRMVRKEWKNLNGLWQLAFAKEGEGPPIGKELGEQILVPFPVQSALSGVMKPAERVWYRRTFEVPEKWSGKRVLLHFGAVNWEATVWLNGKKLGTHRGGYDGFSFDITDHLKKNGPQELIVGVWNPIDGSTQPRGKQVKKPGGIFYTASTGIWQTVWIEPVPTTCIESLKIDRPGRGGVVLTGSQRGEPKNLAVWWKVMDGRRIVIEGGGHVGKPIGVPILNANLWSPEAPFLYDLHVSLTKDDKVV